MEIRKEYGRFATEKNYIMSLDTVLKIGKVLKNSDNCLKHFKYVQSCPKDKKGNYPLCLSFKVGDDFSIDFNNVSIVPENQREKLYYLTFKTSDNDGLVKYIYGDIFYESIGSVKNSDSVVSEKGYYRLPNPNNSKAYQSGSFERGKADYNSIILKKQVLPLFNNSNYNVAHLECIRIQMSKCIANIEKILKYGSAVEYYANNISTPFEDFLNNEELLYDIAIKNNYKKLTKQSLSKLGINQFPETDSIQRGKIFNMPDYRIFIHFDYNGKHWYELKDCFNAVSSKMTEEFVEQCKDGSFVLKKSLYKNLCSGDTKNDIQFPNFSLNDKNKARTFTDEEISSLFYAASYTSKGKLIYKTDIKLIVLPAGNNLTEEDYTEFQNKNNETSIVHSNEYNDNLFSFAYLENNDITKFDLILCKKGGMTSPDSDLVEISGIEKSKLRQTNERISDVAHHIYQERKLAINSDKELLPLSIEYSFLNILGNPFYDEKNQKVKIVENPKYRSHLIKVLPLIYLDNYVNDNVLLPAFIQNVESSIRSDDNKFAFLKYDLKFLYGIQNSKTDKYMELTETKSYKLGFKLGQMSKPLKNAITSFQKSYVGMLTRRITTKDDCIKFVNDICQKLTMHEKAYSDACAEVCNELANLLSSEYDKEHIAFGFFEGYFKYEPNVSKKNLQKRLEKIMVDYQDSNEVINQIQKISEVVESLKDNKNE